MSIKLSNVYKSYGKQEVLHDISFEVKPGELVGFLGPNGAGKSTCIKLITGWLFPDRGSVEVCGHKLSGQAICAKRRMGYLPEHNPLYPEMYVREYLEYVGGIYKISQPGRRIEELAEELALTDVLGKTIGTLSKGYKQRVGLAQALIHNPEVLILDEPFTGLDPNQLDQVHALIRRISKEKAILFSSHSLQEVEEISTRTLIISRGRLMADQLISELTKEQTLTEVFKELTR